MKNIHILLKTRILLAYKQSRQIMTPTLAMKIGTLIRSFFSS